MSDRPATLVLVRHGRTPTTGTELPGRRPGLALSDRGEAEARRTAAVLAGRFDAIRLYSSPLERARQTAAALEAVFGTTAIVDDDLAEVDVGAWTGWSLGRVRRRKEWATLLAAASTFRFPEGESLVDVLARIRGFATRIAERHPGEVVVATSHADPIRLLAADALGIHVDGVHRIWVETASSTTFSVTPTSLGLLTLNERTGARWRR
ncbi:Phosphoglycerate mutase [Acidimicrobium ferrooxidans DSM 10331]|uniref:Phosphoglycerate mutase n=1 Tax=Acidimicrobium ferrooxidans (strain DSM 10331 / JCM 15462 / NBRC 103882 / ICP) TaxID=525909 RepID=C7M2I5_ACIFD|nr:histidine phosphatase family protein [Acidimicrobium ferrooxidans]ACU53229.1 Phosphoglycerate mutase [Acidimicrobium ferrooxidans DSM 10331]